MTSILEYQVNSHMNKSAFVEDIQIMIVESCTPEEIANNEYLREAMK